MGDDPIRVDGIPGRALALAGTDTLTQAVGLDSRLKATLRAICRVAGVSVVALHGIDAFAVHIGQRSV
jgi:hypothetical protein